MSLGALVCVSVRDNFAHDSFVFGVKNARSRREQVHNGRRVAQTGRKLRFFFPTVSEFLAANSSDKRQGKAEAKFVKV